MYEINDLILLIILHNKIVPNYYTYNLHVILYYF